MPAWPRVHYARVEATAATHGDDNKESHCNWRSLLCICFVAATVLLIVLLLLTLSSRNSDDDHQTQWCDIIDCCEQWSSSSSSMQWQPEKRCLKIKSKASWNATCHIHKPEGRMCCKAMLASCLACPYGNGSGSTITVADYCRCRPATAGCKP